MLRNRKIFYFLATFVCLQPYATTMAQSPALVTAAATAGLVNDAAEVAQKMWAALNGDTTEADSSDAYIGILLAKQLLSMGQVTLGAKGELYINNIAIQDANAGLVYIDQHAELLSPVFIQDGGYAALNKVLLDKANAGAVVISQHLESRGLLTVGPGATLTANIIEINNTRRGK